MPCALLQGYRRQGTFGYPRYSLRFGKDRATRREFYGLRRSEAKVPYLFHPDMEYARDHLEELPASAGALLVEDEVDDLSAFVELDCLAELVADIDYVLTAGRNDGPRRMTGDSVAVRSAKSTMAAP